MEKNNDSGVVTVRPELGCKLVFAPVTIFGKIRNFFEVFFYLLGMAFGVALMLSGVMKIAAL